MLSVALLTACATSAPLPQPGAPLPTVGNGSAVALTEVWLLDRLGPSPTDTVVRFSAATGRTIVIRHPRPDHAVFAILTFPPGILTAAQGDSITVRVRPLPGRYGMAIDTDDTFVGFALGTFSYAAHFSAPTGSTARYPTSARLEAALGAARLTDTTKVLFLPSERPAGDMLRFAIARAGTYLLAAPR